MSDNASYAPDSDVSDASDASSSNTGLHMEVDETASDGCPIREDIVYNDPADPSPHLQTDYTLEDFVSEGVQLMASRDTDPQPKPFDGTDAGLMRLAQWALTGRHPDSDIQANIIPTKANPGNLKVLCDFDSFLCISRHLEHVWSSLDVYRMCPIHLRIATNLHIKCIFQLQEKKVYPFHVTVPLINQL